jgi:hypothetical protein
MPAPLRGETSVSLARGCESSIEFARWNAGRNQCFRPAQFVNDDGVQLVEGRRSYDGSPVDEHNRRSGQSQSHGHGDVPLHARKNSFVGAACPNRSFGDAQSLAVEQQDFWRQAAGSVEGQPDEVPEAAARFGGAGRQVNRERVLVRWERKVSPYQPDPRGVALHDRAQDSVRFGARGTLEIEECHQRHEGIRGPHHWRIVSRDSPDGVRTDRRRRSVHRSLIDQCRRRRCRQVTPDTVTDYQSTTDDGRDRQNGDHACGTLTSLR